MTNREFTTAVLVLIEQGYGAENIAIEIERPLEEVRSEIKRLRSEGVLKKIFTPPQKA